MSGSVSVEKSYEWFSINISDQLCRPIPTIMKPDGTTDLEPQDFYGGLKKEYLDWSDKLEPEISNVLKELLRPDSALLLPYDSSLPAVNYSAAAPCNFNFYFSPQNSTDDICLSISVSKPITVDTRKCIRDEVERLLRIDTAPFLINIKCDEK